MPSLDVLAAGLLHRLNQRGYTLSLAESCTGGAVSSALTDQPGSSAVLGLCVVAYSDDAKVTVLGVDPDELARYGPVSPQIASAMAMGVRRLACTTHAAAVTGVTGPASHAGARPGTVVTAVDGREGTSVRRHAFEGDRLSVKEQAAFALLSHLSDEIH